MVSSRIRRDSSTLLEQVLDRMVGKQFSASLLTQKVYGRDGVRERKKLQNMIYRIRQRRPDLEIDTFSGYRISRREPGEALRSRAYLRPKRRARKETA